MIPAANAVLVEAATVKIIEIIATVIIGSGFVFRAVEDARAAAGQIWGWIQTNRTDIATFFETWATQYTGLDKINKGIRVSGQVIDAIREAVSSLTTVDASGQYFGDWVSFTGSTVADFTMWCDSIDWGAMLLHNPIHVFKINGDTYSSAVADATHINFYKNGTFIYRNWVLSTFKFSLSLSVYSGKLSQSLNIMDDSSVVSSSFFWMDDKGTKLCDLYDYPITVDIPNGLIGVSGDLVYPSEDYIVKAPDLPDVITDADGKELVVYPDLSLNPADHLADIPKTAEGEKVDVPYDVIVDTTTGEQIDVDNPDIPDIPDTPSGSLPKPGDLTIPQLIITKFPFSIPFDLYAMLQVVDADPVAPVFHIPIKIPNVADTEFVLEFSQYAELVEILRWGEYILFLVGLAIVTRNVIKW